MASHDDLMSIIKSLIESLEAMGNKFSEMENISDRLRKVEENMCTAKDVKIITNRLTGLEANMCTSEEVKIIADRLTGLEGKTCTSEEVKVIADRLNGLDIDANTCTSEDIKVIVDRLILLEEKTYTPEGEKIIANKETRSEDNMITSEEMKIIADRLTQIEQKMCTSMEVKVIADRMTKFEGNMCTSKEVKVIADRLTKLERRISTESSSAEAKDLCESIISIQDNLTSTINYRSPLKFDPEFKGNQIELSDDCLTATRINPDEESGNAGVVTERPLRDNEMFSIRIEETIEEHKKFSISIGVICDPDYDIETSDNIHWSDGTWSILSYAYQRPGYSTTLKDDNKLDTLYDLDLRDISVGTVLGVKRNRKGRVRFYLDGEDMGLAFSDVPRNVHGFVDVSHFVTKISIVE